MNEIELSKKRELLLEKLLLDEITVFDDDFFEVNVFSSAENDIVKIQKNLFYNLMAGSPAIAEIINNLGGQETFKIVLSPEALDKIQKGVYKFMNGDGVNGLFRAMVVDGNGRIVEVPFIEEITNEIDPAQLTSAMQGMAIQMKLKKIEEQLVEISNALNDVLAGQHNDRLAKYYAGAALYKEAMEISNEEIRRHLVDMAVVTLSEGYSELVVSLKYDIENLCADYSEEKGRFLHTKPIDIIRKMAIINSAFQAIHKAQTLKAAIYIKESEYQAAVTTLGEYGKLVERLLSVKTVNILRNADLNETSGYGIWGERSLELPQVIREIEEQINDRSRYFLEFTRGDLYEQIQMQ